MKKILSNSEVYEFLSLYKLVWIGGEYINNTRKTLECMDSDGYKIITSINVLEKGNAPRKICKSNPFTIYNVKRWLYTNNNEIEFVDNNYVSAKYKYKLKCKKMWKLFLYGII